MPQPANDLVADGDLEDAEKVRSQGGSSDSAPYGADCSFATSIPAALVTPSSPDSRPTPDEVERLLAELPRDDGAANRLVPLVYDELRELARQVRRGPSSETVNTTALVHEAYLRLSRGAGFESKSHFLGVAAKAMRHVLVDHARRRSAEKRGGDLDRVELSDTLVGSAGSPRVVLALDRALDQLAALDARKARVVECRFFGDLSVQETAEALGISTATVKRDWRMAQAWLYRALAPDPD